jgi:hypothetical protein
MTKSSGMNSCGSRMMNLNLACKKLGKQGAGSQSETITGEVNKRGWVP